MIAVVVGGRGRDGARCVLGVACLVFGGIIIWSEPVYWWLVVAVAVLVCAVLTDWLYCTSPILSCHAWLLSRCAPASQPAPTFRISVIRPELCCVSSLMIYGGIKNGFTCLSFREETLHSETVTVQCRALVSSHLSPGPTCSIVLSNLPGCQLSIAESSESVAEDWVILLCSLLDPDETLEQDVGLGQWVMGQVGAVSQGQYKVTGLDTGLFMEEDIWTVITDSLSLYCWFRMIWK